MSGRDECDDCLRKLSLKHKILAIVTVVYGLFLAIVPWEFIGGPFCSADENGYCWNSGGEESFVFMSRWKNHLKTVCSTQVDTEYCQGGPSCDDYYSFRARWDTPAEPYFWILIAIEFILFICLVVVTVPIIIKHIKEETQRRIDSENGTEPQQFPGLNGTEPQPQFVQNYGQQQF